MLNSKWKCNNYVVCDCQRDELNDLQDYIDIKLDDIVDTRFKFEEVFGNELLEKAKKK